MFHLFNQLLEKAVLKPIKEHLLTKKHDNIIKIFVISMNALFVKVFSCNYISKTCYKYNFTS